MFNIAFLSEKYIKLSALMSIYWNFAYWLLISSMQTHTHTHTYKNTQHTTCTITHIHSHAYSRTHVNRYMYRTTGMLTAEQRKTRVRVPIAHATHKKTCNVIYECVFRQSRSARMCVRVSRVLIPSSSFDTRRTASIPAAACRLARAT